MPKTLLAIPSPIRKSTPFWTNPAPSGCPLPPKQASPRSAAEVDKKSNFIEFYKISRSLDLEWRGASRAVNVSAAPHGF